MDKFLTGFLNKPSTHDTAANTLSWKADDAFKSRLTIDDAKFIFDQAEKLLADSVATSETIVTRMNTLLTLITGSFIALCGFIISRLGDHFQFDSFVFTACVGLIYLYVLIIYSFKNIQPKDYIVAGTPAADLFNPAFFSEQIPDKDRILRYYVNEVENSFYKTEINNDLNEVRWKRFSIISKCLVFLPLILLLCYICTTF